MSKNFRIEKIFYTEFIFAHVLPNLDSCYLLYSTQKPIAMVPVQKKGCFVNNSHQLILKFYNSKENKQQEKMWMIHIH